MVLENTVNMSVPSLQFQRSRPGCDPLAAGNCCTTSGLDLCPWLVGQRSRPLFLHLHQLVHPVDWCKDNVKLTSSILCTLFTFNMRNVFSLTSSGGRSRSSSTSHPPPSSFPNPSSPNPSGASMKPSERKRGKDTHLIVSGSSSTTKV